jgi:hypothetical protein
VDDLNAIEKARPTMHRCNERPIGAADAQHHCEPARLGAAHRAMVRNIALTVWVACRPKNLETGLLIRPLAPACKGYFP